MPIVLMLKETPKGIRGINLNFCNRGLTTLILNTITNLDENFFFEGLLQKMVFNKVLPVSPKVYAFLVKEDAEKQIKDQLKRYYPNADYDIIFRNYTASKINDVRMIEPWQWKYLPSLTYANFDKGNTLKAIQTIAGIDKIEI